MTFGFIFFRPYFPIFPYPSFLLNLIFPLTLVFFALFGHDTTLFPP